MKKTLMALTLCLISVTTFAQLEFKSESFITETVDEFGDKTGNIKVGIFAKGYFSNSATTNSCANLTINVMKDNSWISMYEYCDNHATKEAMKVSFEGTTTKEKVETGTKVPITFVVLCKDNDTIKVRVKGMESYSTTSAVFKLFDCKAFYDDYIKTFGEIEYKPYQYSDNNKFLYIFPKPVPDGEDYDTPRLIFNTPYLVQGVPTKRRISYGGKFEDGNGLFSYTKRVVIDGRDVKMESIYTNWADFDDFMKKLKVGSVVEVYCKYDNVKPVRFEITQDLYWTIRNFCGV